MSSVSTNMIGIHQKPLYFNMLSSNFKDHRNKVFLFFYSTRNMEKLLHFFNVKNFPKNHYSNAIG